MRKGTKFNSMCSTNSVDFKNIMKQRKYSIGQLIGTNNMRFKSDSGDILGQYPQNNSQISKGISPIKAIEEGKIFRQSRDQSFVYPQEDVKHIFLGQQNKLSNNGDNQRGGSQGQQSNCFQQQSSFNSFQWKSNYPGATNNQFNHQNSLNESKRSAMGSQNSGIFTNSIFFQKKPLNSQLNKSQSHSILQKYQSSHNYSRYDNENNFSTQYEVLPKVEKQKSINDLLHRNNVSLNISEQIAKMDKITNKMIQKNENQKQSQNEYMQKQDENQNQKEEEPQKAENTINNKQYFVQLQRQLQVPIEKQNNSITRQQKSINQEIQMNLLENQETNQISNGFKTSNASNVIDSIQNNNENISKTGSQQKLNQIIKQQDYLVLQNKQKNNIFSLTRTNVKARNKFPYQDVLSLCNQNFLDNINALRKAINRDEQDTINQIQQHLSYDKNNKQIEGLEGVSLFKNKDFVKPYKLHSDIKHQQSKSILKSEINEGKTNQFKLEEHMKVNSDRTRAPSQLLLSKTKGNNNWNGSNNFKIMKNYNKFTLKQLRKALSKDSKFNPDGSSTQWKFYLQDTVKQNNDIQNSSKQNDKFFNESDVSSDIQSMSRSYNDEQYDKIYSFDKLGREINNQKELLKNKNEKDQYDDQNQNTSFYKMLKKQNIHLLDNKNGNISSYEIIDEQFDKIYKTSFQKNLAIRKVDMIYSIKRLALLKYKREKKLLEGSQDPKDLLDYINKKNKIQILLLNAKKISNLQEVAQIIENKINQQNNRINSIVDQMLIKFDINQQS